MMQEFISATAASIKYTILSAVAVLQLHGAILQSPCISISGLEVLLDSGRNIENKL